MTDESVQKKRMMIGLATRKPSDISLGGDQTSRTQSAAVSEWSDDDGALVAPPSSTEAPSRDTCVEVQPEGGEGVPEQQVEETPTAGEARPPAQDTRVDPKAVPGCSGRQRRFRTVYRKANV